jgi:hypothetical protein
MGALRLDRTSGARRTGTSGTRARPRGLRTSASLAAVLALAASVGIAIVGTLGVNAAGPAAADSRPVAMTAEGAVAWRPPTDRTIRPIPPAFASGGLLVVLLTTSAITIRLARRPKRRSR